MRLNLVAIAFVICLFAVRPATAEEPQVTVDRARIAVASILGDRDFEAARNHLAKAKAVLIVPELVKAGLIIGGEAGDGVLLVRGRNGSWSDPAFYLLAAGSIGLQIGVETKEMLVLVMTEKGLGSLMSDQVKLGADASLAVGTFGGGISASSVGTVGADFIAFSKSKGLFGGGALDGALLRPQADKNAAFYGAPATPKQILIERRFTSANARGLKDALSQY